jgi:hypothetical protein
MKKTFTILHANDMHSSFIVMAQAFIERLWKSDQRVFVASHK